ncbi:hypothetical protein PIB30_019937 [Stylosanthes scabra]|uniref:Uncharacterized protein n=1 Tax=Stylosanthes scabra TaxID=79078 RepID=A0ABU6W8I3_9FABA|nr:hypothetical protein [Stylosanthes scabra]
MGVIGTMLVRPVAYCLLNIFPPNQFKFKIFWVEGDEHVRAMFDLHHRYGSREVMELLTEMQTVHGDVVGPSSSAGGVVGVIPCSLIHYAAPELSTQMELNSDDDSDEDFVISYTDDSSESSDDAEFVLESQSRHEFLLPAPAPILDLSSANSHLDTLHLDGMEEELRDGFCGGGDDYDVDDGQELRVGHRFSTRKDVHLRVKNYNIRRVSEYRVVELDPYKEVRRFGGPHDCLAPFMSSDHAQLDGRLN